MTIDTSVLYNNCFLNNNISLFDTKISINHWQLRDLVKGSSSIPYKINYVFGNKIKSFSSYSGSGSSAYINEYENENVDEVQEIPCANELVLNYKPKCFQEIDEFYVAAGIVEQDQPYQPLEKVENIEKFNIDLAANINDWRGVLTMKQQHLHQIEEGETEESAQPISVSLGKFINNDVALFSTQRGVPQHPAGGDCEIFVCNNDNNLYLLNNDSKKGLNLVNVTNDLKTSVNSCNLSHDGSKVIISGDSNKFAIYNHNVFNHDLFDSFFYKVCPGNNSIERIFKYDLENDQISKIDHTMDLWKTLSSKNCDYGFSSSFNESNLQFTTVFQTGLAMVYDVRKVDQPLHTVESTKPNTTQGAFRVCKYSGDIDNLLFISENVGIVHVLDTRNFHIHRLIRFPPSLHTGPAYRSSDLKTIMSDSYPSYDFSDEHRYAAYYSSNSSSLSEYSDSPNVNYLEDSLHAPTEINNDFLKPVVIPFEQNVSKHETPSLPFLYQTSNNSPQEDSAADTNINNYMDDTLHISRFHTLHPEVPSVTKDSVSTDEDMKLQSLKRPRTSSHLPEHMRYSQNLLNSTNTPLNSSVTSSASLNAHHRNTYEMPNKMVHFKENDISGIDWVQDNEGTSLLIGTSLGIYKWGITSSLKNSLSTYDFS